MKSNTRCQLEQHCKVSGYSIIELLIAVFLTFILTIAASQSYQLNKKTFRATQGISDVQQNLRFASYFLNKELRQAGNLGCFQGVKSHLEVGLSEPDDESNLIPLYDMSKSVNVWQYKPSDDDLDLGSSDAYTTPDDSASSWVDSNGRVRPSVLAGRAMIGSDILLVTKVSEPLDVSFIDANSPVIASLGLQDGSVVDFNDGQIVLVGDCSSSELFVQAEGGALDLTYTTSSDYQPRNRPFTQWRRNWQSTHELRTLESTLYYVGMGASGLPALFRLDVGSGVGGEALHEEVVDGIEVMKVILGFDTDNDRRIDGYYSPSSLSSESGEVLAVQTGLLAVAGGVLSNGGSDEELNIKDYEILPGFSVKSPEFWNTTLDRRVRYVSSSSVHLRNAGLARSAEVEY